MAEAIINSWTVIHFVFGIAVALIVSILMETRYPVSSVSLFILVLYEAFEFRETPVHWRVNILNNIVDIIVGYVAVVFILKAMDLIDKK